MTGGTTRTIMAARSRTRSISLTKPAKIAKHKSKTRKTQIKKKKVSAPPSRPLKSVALESKMAEIKPETTAKPVATSKETTRQKELKDPKREMVKREMVNWDGSYLGDWKGVEVQAKFKHKARIYFKLLYKGQILICRGWSASNTFSCLVDESKPYFGLIKTGTHWLTFGTRVMILSRVYDISNLNLGVSVGSTLTSTSTPTSTSTLTSTSTPTSTSTSTSDFQYSALFEGQTLSQYMAEKCSRQCPKQREYNRILENLTPHIQSLYVFSLMFNLSQLNHGSIAVNSLESPKLAKIVTLAGFKPLLGDEWQPVYYVTTVKDTLASQSHYSNLASAVINRWFHNKTPNRVAKEICRLRKRDQIPRYCFATRCYLESVVKRVDPKLINLVDPTVTRILSLLDPELPEK